VKRAKRIELLVVEDNPLDIIMSREALSQAKMGNHVNIVTDGVQAMQFLHREEPYTDAPHPDLVILDLNLPRKHGKEVLQEMKNNPELTRIPVVVLSTSGSVEDVGDSYDLHANCFITKPLEPDQFSRVIECIQGFWLSVVNLLEE